MAHASTAPGIAAVWVSDVGPSSARLHGEVEPDEGLPTEYWYQYLSQATYDANIAEGRDAFARSFSAPSRPAVIAAGVKKIGVYQLIGSLAPATRYVYRLNVRNGTGSVTSTAHYFITQSSQPSTGESDGRSWELVSPIDKNGGGIAGAGEIAGGGVFQAAANGSAVTFSSTASFADASGAPVASQYISARSDTGWVTTNITPPTVSGSYGSEPRGVPFQLFAPNLSVGIMLNGEHCRGAQGSCPVLNPPLPGSEAPPGFQDYYLRDSASGVYRALITTADIEGRGLEPSQFDVHLAGATPQVDHDILSTCAALTDDATEIGSSEGGCDETQANLYEWSGGGLKLVNILPEDSLGSPGATLPSQSASISEDGQRIYFVEGGRLYLRDGASTHAVGASLSGSEQFEGASADGTGALLINGGRLYRYDEVANTVRELASEVSGVLGYSRDLARVYYVSGGTLFLWRQAGTTTVASGPGAVTASDYQDAGGTTRVAPDGGRMLFLSTAPLTGYDNVDQRTGERDSEVFLYDVAARNLACLSCNPSNERPWGPSGIPGTNSNGQYPEATSMYKPRVLLSGGKRVVFESSDSLVAQDRNFAKDVYEWEAGGIGSCEQASGCVSLISSGKAETGAAFFDASESGDDIFFRTPRSLVPGDPGGTDLYDARVAGGFPEEDIPIPCEGDACQPLPSGPSDPAVNSLATGPGNPPVHFYDTNRIKPRYHRLRHHHHKGVGHKHRRKGNPKHCRRGQCRAAKAARRRLRRTAE